jgi:hypothetical protein
MKAHERTGDTMTSKQRPTPTSGPKGADSAERQRTNTKQGPNAALDGDADENASKMPFAPEHDARTNADRDGNATHARTRGVPQPGGPRGEPAPAKRGS